LFNDVARSLGSTASIDRWWANSELDRKVVAWADVKPWHLLEGAEYNLDTSHSTAHTCCEEVAGSDKWQLSDKIMTLYKSYTAPYVSRLGNMFRLITSHLQASL
jgi:hypothetical protein